MTDTTTIFTFAQFAMIGVFAVLVIIGILFGMRMKRRRLDAEADVEAHREAVGEKAEASSAPPPAGEAPLPVPAVPVVPTGDMAVEAVSVEAILAETAPAAPFPENVAAPPSTPTPVPATITLAGDITQLKGLGPKLATALAGLGITRVDQIATMSPSELADLDSQLGAFKGRPARDRWAEQAALLVAGDKAAYEAEFGKLG
uniref:helix-hairpin-helix domain-containing protein n=1 Tax=Sphingomonas sp. TaxID=28214 RepID=UPI0025E55C0E|nr:helix-hairpin-helix domain-containing protein [Sphingomonas sp.]